MAIAYNIIDLGISEFKDTWNLQKELQEKRILGEIEDQLILVEHPAVYTLGKNASKEHILKRKEGVSVIQTDRGGNITFHGPGQLVGYPILDLNFYKRSITWYMRELEQLMIDVLKEYGIEGSTKKGLTGTWVKDHKIAALGVRIRRWVTMHGFSLNISPDLRYYKDIIPCGIQEYGVTSMAMIMGEEVPSMDEVKIKMVDYFKNRFVGFKN
ncbi:lipoyl(octanoyl) transferase LipB [bacterium]|nr:lipoyl(octanoyl) transferase LipB [bacterium]MBT4249804.1 lipoyl(octanoyl) transferase LipB [bacterium]MBT4927369.1 lipoyl(octanoyl) transferase LipB [bacterium]MBT6018986.1 lipoyl(octanoyl) transferase LipB [bacterium]MBT6777476.1 lipoyl(octanoyl) transferase LipB [bacterium]